MELVMSSDVDANFWLIAKITKEMQKTLCEIMD